MFLLFNISVTKNTSELYLFRKYNIKSIENLSKVFLRSDSKTVKRWKLANLALGQIDFLIGRSISSNHDGRVKIHWPFPLFNLQYNWTTTITTNKIASVYRCNYHLQIKLSLYPFLFSIQVQFTKVKNVHVREVLRLPLIDHIQITYPKNPYNAPTNKIELWNHNTRKEAN